MAAKQHSEAVFVNSCVKRAPKKRVKLQMAATLGVQSGRVQSLEVLGKSLDVVMDTTHGVCVDNGDIDRTRTGGQEIPLSTYDDRDEVVVDPMYQKKRKEEEENEYTVADDNRENEKNNSDDDNVESMKLDMETISSESFYRKLQELKEENYKTLRMMDVLYRDSLSSKTVGYGTVVDERRQQQQQQQQAWAPQAQYDDIDTETEIRPDLDVSSSSLSKISKMWDEFSVDEYAPREKPSGSHSFKTKPRDVKRTEEWTPQITVPKPFRMTIRDAMKPQKLSRSQIDMFKEIIEKERTEERECEQKFRANPAPGHIYLPLYDEITRRNEQRRRDVKEHSEDVLRAMEKPFSFVKREEDKRIVRTHSAQRVPLKTVDFTARSVPKHIYDDSASERLKEEELFRDIRIKMRSEELLKKSQLPKNMQLRGREYTLGELRKKLQAERESIAFMTDEHNFNPCINHDVPDYTQLHRRFQDKVRHCKQAKEPTVVQPFKLETSRIPSRKEKILQDMENDERLLTENRWPYQAPRCAPTPGDPNKILSPDSIPTKMTHSAQLRQNKTVENLNSLTHASIELNQRDEERKFRECKLGRFIASRSSSYDNSRTLDEVRSDKVRKHKESDRCREAAYKNELEEMMGRVNSRPLLFEREEQINARRAAEKRYEDALKSAGCDKFVRNQGGTDGEGAYGYISVSESDDEDSSSNYYQPIADE